MKMKLNQKKMLMKKKRSLKSQRLKKSQLLRTALASHQVESQLKLMRMATQSLFTLTPMVSPTTTQETMVLPCAWLGTLTSHQLVPTTKVCHLLMLQNGADRTGAMLVIHACKVPLTRPTSQIQALSTATMSVPRRNLRQKLKATRFAQESRRPM